MTAEFFRQKELNHMKKTFLFAILTLSITGAAVAAKKEFLNPEVRSVDRACLPASAPAGSIPMYSKDVKARYMEIADIDSFQSTETDEAVTKQQLVDLERKGREIGADAIVKVRKLNNTHAGFVNDPETPFNSYKQGEEKTYFFRAVAIRYLQPVPGTPKLISAQNRRKALTSGHSEVLDTNYLLRTQGNDANADNKQKPLTINLP